MGSSDSGHLPPFTDAPSRWLDAQHSCDARGCVEDATVRLGIGNYKNASERWMFRCDRHMHYRPGKREFIVARVRMPARNNV